MSTIKRPAVSGRSTYKKLKNALLFALKFSVCGFVDVSRILRWMYHLLLRQENLGNTLRVIFVPNKIAYFIYFGPMLGFFWRLFRLKFSRRLNFAEYSPRILIPLKKFYYKKCYVWERGKKGRFVHLYYFPIKPFTYHLSVDFSWGIIQIRFYNSLNFFLNRKRRETNGIPVFLNRIKVGERRRMKSSMVSTVVK